MNVTFDPSFFVNTARRDYGDPAEAFLREFIQNSRDADATRIDFKVFADDVGNTIFECYDDGHGMDENTIVSKLMAVGSSGKPAGAGKTGGFGVAKILIYFAQSAYMIRTQDLIVRGSGSAYTIERGLPFVKGVTAQVHLNKDVIGVTVEGLVRRFTNEIRLSYLPGLRINLNSLPVAAERKRGRQAEDMGTGVKVYKRKLDKGCTTSRFHVRVRGLHMFSMYCAEMKHEVIVELTDYSTDLLTTNRDGFRGEWRDKVSSYVQALALNSSKGSESKVHFWRGFSSRIAQRATAAVAKVNEALAGVGELITQGAEGAALVAEAVKEALAGEDAEVVEAAVAAVVKTQGAPIEVRDMTPRFHYYVETVGKYKKIPKKWEPANFSDRQKRLLELWAAVVGKVLEDAGKPGEFDVGFIIDDGTTGEEAALAKHVPHDGRPVFLLNPLAYGTEQKLPGLKSMELMHYLLSLATHEVTHAVGYGLHNESFVAAEFEIRRKSMKRIKEYTDLRLK